MNIKLASQCLKQMIEADIPVMLSGPPGVGKSEVVYQVGAAMKRNVVDVRVSRMDPVDLHGMPVPDIKAKSTIWLIPAMLPQADRDGDEGILFLDELNAASPAMQVACYGLILERRLGEYKLPKGWVPVAAGNRVIDKASASRMPTALRNRFAHFEIAPDIDAWIEWANKNKIPPIVAAFLRFRSELLHKMPAGEENSFPTPRAWEKVARVADAPESVRQYLVGALVGDGPAAEFEGFARLWTRLPNIDHILANPKTANVPDDSEPALYYALATAIARRADRTNLDAVLIYAARLPKEFEILTAVDAVKRDPSLTRSRAFAAWAARNQEVTL